MGEESASKPGRFTHGQEAPVNCRRVVRALLKQAKSLPWLVTEPRFSGCPTCSLVTVLSYRGSSKAIINPLNERTKKQRYISIVRSLGRFPGLAICPSDKISSKIKTSTEHWWDDSDRRKEVKVKFTLEQATKTRGGGSRCIALLFNLGARWRRVVNATPRPLYPREIEPVPIVQEVGWAPGPIWTVAENLAPSEFDPRTVQPAASRYTDYANRAPRKQRYWKKNPS